MNEYLFSDPVRLNLRDGNVVFHSDAIANADLLFEQVRTETPWSQEQITLFGQRRDMPRLTSWMGDAAYTYSGLENVPAPWSDPVLELRRIAEKLAGVSFNGVLLNLYRTGADSMGRHADDEASLGPSPVIASISLGASRRFRFIPKPHNTAESVAIELTHGSVLIMRDATQSHWFHEIPKTKRAVGQRINLTFRKIVDPVAT